MNFLEFTLDIMSSLLLLQWPEKLSDEFGPLAPAEIEVRVFWNRLGFIFGWKCGVGGRDIRTL